MYRANNINLQQLIHKKMATIIDNYASDLLTQLPNLRNLNKHVPFRSVLNFFGDVTSNVWQDCK